MHNHRCCCVEIRGLRAYFSPKIQMFMEKRSLIAATSLCDWGREYPRLKRKRGRVWTGRTGQQTLHIRCIHKQKQLFALPRGDVLKMLPSSASAHACMRAVYVVVPRPAANPGFRFKFAPYRVLLFRRIKKTFGVRCVHQTRPNPTVPARRVIVLRSETTIVMSFSR